MNRDRKINISDDDWARLKVLSNRMLRKGVGFAPGVVLSALIRDRHDGMPLRDWLEAMPRVVEGKKIPSLTMEVEITLAATEWLDVKHAAEVNGTTMDEVLSILLTEKHDSISTLANSGYSLEPGPGD